MREPRPQRKILDKRSTGEREKRNPRYKTETKSLDCDEELDKDCTKKVLELFEESDPFVGRDGRADHRVPDRGVVGLVPLEEINIAKVRRQVHVETRALALGEPDGVAEGVQLFKQYVGVEAKDEHREFFDVSDALLIVVGDALLHDGAGG